MSAKIPVRTVSHAATGSKIKQNGLSAVVDEVVGKMRTLYLADQTPWVVGYSGGKDSSAVLQLLWTMLSRLAEEERSKVVHVISTDTLVENPIVSAWVRE